MLPELFIQQLKQSCDMERIVSGYLPLKKKGRYLGDCVPSTRKRALLFMSIRRISLSTASDAEREAM